MSLGGDRTQNVLGIYQVLVLGAVALVVLSVTLLLGITLVGDIAVGLEETKDPRNKTASPNPQTGEVVSFEDTTHSATIHDVWSVRDSQGNAVRLTGADDSYIQSQEDVDLASDDTWTVSTWAAVNSSATGETMTAVSANARVIIEYNGSDSQWSAWYYKEGSRDSYRVNVSAPSPTDYTLVTATANSTHFTIYRNTTQGEVVDITTSSIEDATVEASNWDGTLDETRVFDDATNDSQQSDLHSNPVAPRKDRDRSARIMYDEGHGDTTAIYFTGARADVSNATWVDGLPGNDLVEGTDYELDQEAGTITAVAGGKIDGAPVVWIEYRYEPLNKVGKLAAVLTGAYGLFATSVLIIPAVAILAVLLVGVRRAVQAADQVDDSVELFGKRGNR